jgi:hypothetical protein
LHLWGLTILDLRISPLKVLRISALALSHFWVVDELGSWVGSVLVCVGRHVVSLAWALSSLLGLSGIVVAIVDIWTEPCILWLEVVGVGVD